MYTYYTTMIPRVLVCNRHIKSRRNSIINRSSCIDGCHRASCSELGLRRIRMATMGWVVSKQAQKGKIWQPSACFAESAAMLSCSAHDPRVFRQHAAFLSGSGNVSLASTACVAWFEDPAMHILRFLSYEVNLHC